MTTPLITYYQQRKQRFEHKHRRLKRLSARLAWSRLFAFLLFILFLYLGFQTTGWHFALSFLCIGLFIFLVIKSEQIKERITLYEHLIRLNQQETDCQHYTFSQYDEGAEWLDPHHPFASDLDIFGPKSLFQFINRSQTIWGRHRLAEKLTGIPTDPQTIHARQASIQELSKKIALRQRFWAYAGFHQMSPNEYEQLKTFLSQSIPVVHTKLFQVIRRIMPGLFILLLAGAIFNAIPWMILVVYFILQYSVTSLYLKSTHATHARLEKQNRPLSILLGLFIMLRKQPFQATDNTTLKKRLFAADRDCVQEILQFKKIVNAFDLRLHWLMNILLNGSMLWDLQCLHKLETWRQNHGDKVPGYLETLGMFDASFCLANMAFNHPASVYPTLTEEPVLQATEVGHPLIPPDRRVNNNISIGQEGRFTIITGANMAGKSTFLRTLGINHWLACNGLPVMAGEYTCQPMPLFTSMRTKDSLGENESYFYAELKRLRQLVALIDTGHRPLILLDEILKGTNSADKLKGSIAFLKQLIRHQCTGVIATHDLALTDMEKEFPAHIVNKCFEIQIENGHMHFDYKLQDGVTKHMNAWLLMKQMGIISG